MFIQYLSQIAPGSFTTANIEVPIVQGRINQRSTNITQNRSMDQLRAESVVTGSSFQIAIRTIALPNSDLAAWEDFRDNMELGGTFTIDPLGTQAAPDNARTVRLVPGSLSINPASTLYFNVSFEVWYS